MCERKWTNSWNLSSSENHLSILQRIRTRSLSPQSLTAWHCLRLHATCACVGTDRKPLIYVFCVHTFKMRLTDKKGEAMNAAIEIERSIARIGAALVWSLPLLSFCLPLLAYSSLTRLLNLVQFKCMLNVPNGPNKGEGRKRRSSYPRSKQQVSSTAIDCKISTSS